MSKLEARGVTALEGEPADGGPDEKTPGVVALVGPAGTGKSHRASVVAADVGAELILDDGLLVSTDGRILAGRSAKREPNRAAAVRRALLEDPDHLAAVKEALAKARPRTVLILGVSAEMVRRIAARAGLPAPSRYIAIEEVASPGQIRQARRIRASEGKHVIPAPTLEVSKSFVGYPVDPLKVFVRTKPRQKPPAPGRFIEKSVVRPTWSSLGRFYIDEVVLAAIAAGAAAEVPGVARVVESRADASREAEAEFELAVEVCYGAFIPETASRVAAHVQRMVEHMTGLGCRKVQVRVVSVARPARQA